jgi:hypothetical protein
MAPAEAPTNYRKVPKTMSTELGGHRQQPLDSVEKL